MDSVHYLVVRGWILKVGRIIGGVANDGGIDVGERGEAEQVLRLKLDQLVVVKVDPLEHIHALGEVGQVGFVVEALRLEVL